MLHQCNGTDIHYYYPMTWAYKENECIWHMEESATYVHAEGN